MTGERIALPTYETLLTEAIRSLAVDSGTVSVVPPAGAPVLQDSSKNWSANVHAGRLVKIIRGTGAGQLRVVQSNTDTVLTVIQAWTIPLNTTSVYVILGEAIVSALLDMNLRQWGGVVLTGRDVSLDLANLDAALSTRATEATLATRASEATLASILGALDVALSTRASEATVASLLAQLDVALSTRAASAQLPAAPTVAGNLKVSIEEQSITPSVQERRTITVVPDTNNGVIALAVLPAMMFKLIQVRCHFFAAPASVGAFTVTLNAGDGAAYDTLLYSRDPSVGSLTDLVVEFGEGHIYEADDEIDVAYANPDGRTYGVALVWEAIRTAL
jgi:hypothetical protein